MLDPAETGWEDLPDDTVVQRCEICDGDEAVGLHPWDGSCRTRLCGLKVEIGGRMQCDAGKYT